MLSKTLPVIGIAALALPALSTAAEVDTGSVPATQPQIDVMQEVPDSVTTRKPEARGMTAEEMPVSPLQGQVSEELDARFGYLDIDRDGQISRSEGESNPDLESQWQRLDSNSDNQLNPAEFAGFESGTH